MDSETAGYIYRHYQHLLGADEKSAVWNLHMKRCGNHRMSAGIVKNALDILQKHGWLKGAEDMTRILEEEDTAFEQRVAERIYALPGYQILINSCLRCGQLARTPLARQCRCCGYSWHNTRVCCFRLQRAYRGKGGLFIMEGSAIEAQPVAGNFIDLRRFGIRSIPGIKDVIRLNDTLQLKVSELTEEQEQLLAKAAPPGGDCEIMNRR